MNKKAMTIIGVLLLVSVLFFGYNQFLAPETSAGEKEITIEIYSESQGIDEKMTVRTDAEFLLGLLEENQSDLEAVIEDSDYGPVLMGLMGYVSDFSSDYWGILVNGEYGMLGIADQPVNDGDIFRFELTGL